MTLVRIALTREPVTEPLTGPFAGCTLTLRRLTANEFAQAKDAAAALLRDSARLVELLEEYDLRPRGKKIRALLADAPFMLGVGEWLAAVECGERAISAWTGFADADGRPVEPTRKALEAAFLSEPFLRQVVPMIDRAAQLLVIEGKGSGLSPSGSPARAPTASGPDTATTAGRATNPAPPDAPAATAGSAPRSSTRRSRSKAPPSGG